MTRSPFCLAPAPRPLWELLGCLLLGFALFCLVAPFLFL